MKNQPAQSTGGQNQSTWLGDLIERMKKKSVEPQKKRRFVHATGFGDDTLYIETIGSDVYIITRKKSVGYSLEEVLKIAEAGLWIEISENATSAPTPIERLCDLRQRIGYFEGALIGLRYRVDDATRALIDDVLKKWEGK